MHQCDCGFGRPMARSPGCTHTRGRGNLEVNWCFSVTVLHWAPSNIWNTHSPSFMTQHSSSKYSIVLQREKHFPWCGGLFLPVPVPNVDLLMVGFCFTHEKTCDKPGLRHSYPQFPGSPDKTALILQTFPARFQRLEKKTKLSHRTHRFVQGEAQAAMFVKHKEPPLPFLSEENRHVR